MAELVPHSVRATNTIIVVACLKLVIRVFFTDRALKAQGASPPEHHAAAYEAAMAAYLQLDPDAPTDRLAASGIVSTMIANAIRADTHWFWRGPDA